MRSTGPSTGSAMHQPRPLAGAGRTAPLDGRPVEGAGGSARRGAADLRRRTSAADRHPPPACRSDGGVRRRSRADRGRRRRRPRRRGTRDGARLEYARPRTRGTARWWPGPGHSVQPHGSERSWPRIAVEFDLKLPAVHRLGEAGRAQHRGEEAGEILGDAGEHCRRILTAAIGGPAGAREPAPSRPGEAGTERWHQMARWP
jgi:hypothetical protein